MIRFFFLVALLIPVSTAYTQTVIDAKATAETVALYRNLHTLSTQGILFGHHETDAYGVGWTGIPGRSDVKDVCGAYPAVHGWDVERKKSGITLTAYPSRLCINGFAKYTTVGASTQSPGT